MLYQPSYLPSYLPTHLPTHLRLRYVWMYDLCRETPNDVLTVSKPYGNEFRITLNLQRWSSISKISCHLAITSRCDALAQRNGEKRWWTCVCFIHAIPTVFSTNCQERVEPSSRFGRFAKLNEIGRFFLTKYTKLPDITDSSVLSTWSYLKIMISISFDYMEFIRTV